MPSSTRSIHKVKVEPTNTFPVATRKPSFYATDACTTAEMKNTVMLIKSRPTQISLGRRKIFESINPYSALIKREGNNSKRGWDGTGRGRNIYVKTYSLGNIRKMLEVHFQLGPITLVLSLTLAAAKTMVIDE
jgi:hypothetical protein